MATTVKINLAEAGIILQPNQTYTINVDADFVRESGTFQTGSLAVSGLVSFSTDGGPALQSTVPANNSTELLDVNQLQLIFDRDIFPNSGNFYLYQDGSPDELLATFDIQDTELVTFDGVNCYIDITPYLIADTTFYLTSDAGIVIDLAGVPYAGILDENTFRFTTSDLAFPDLRASVSSSFALSAVATIDPANKAFIESNSALTFGNNVFVVPQALMYLGNVNNFLYVEDTPTNIANYPPITDTIYQNRFGFGNYTYTITPNDVNAIKNITENVSTASTSFDPITKVFTIVGTKSQVNTALENLVLTPGTDYDSNFSLTYSVITPENNTASKLQSVTLSTPFDIEISFVLPQNDRIYYRNEESPDLFSSAFISDFDLDPTNQYTISLSSSLGGFYAFEDFSDLTDGTWSRTGSKSTINVTLGLVKFVPYKDVTSNGTFTFTFSKNGNQVESYTIDLIYSGVNQSYSRTYTITSGGSWTPTALEKRYGSASVVIVAGGGGGAPTRGGGGGAGGIVQVINLTSPLKNNYLLSIGAGGGRGTGPNSNGGDGGSTTFDGITSTGGGGGISGIAADPNGGSNASYFGGLGFSGGIYGGGGGAGARGNGLNAFLNAGTYYGGAGGPGFQSLTADAIGGGGWGGGDVYRQPWTKRGSGGNGGEFSLGGSSGVGGAVIVTVIYS